MTEEIIRGVIHKQNSVDGQTPFSGVANIKRETRGD